MRSPLLTVAVMCALGSSGAAEPLGNDPRITSLKIDGALTETPEELGRMLGLDVGARLDEAARAHLPTELANAGYIADVVGFDPVAEGTAECAKGPCVSVHLSLEPVLIDHAEIVGHTVENEKTLIQFFGLEKGAHLRRDRLVDGIRKLGYFGDPKYSGTPTRAVVHLDLEPARVVRHIDVHVSLPLYKDDIRRRMSLRSGMRLPKASELPATLTKEEDRIKEFLHREGFLESAATVSVTKGGRRDWVDLDVRIDRGPWTRVADVVSDFTEKELDTPMACDPELDRAAEEHKEDGKAHLPEGKTGGVCPEGFACRPWPRDFQCRRVRALSEADLKRQFTPGVTLAWWGRIRQEQMREDARTSEQLARERGYPGARVTATYSVEGGGSRAVVHSQVTQKGKVAIHFSGNHSISEKDLLDKITIFTAGSYDDVELQSSSRELRRLYQQHGFLEAVVTAHSHRVDKPGTDEASRARAERSPDRDITFLIDEGPELRLRGVEIVGEVGVGELPVDLAPLRPLLATKVYPRFGALGLGEGGYLTDQQLIQDQERITAWFRVLGYPDTHVRAEVVRDRAAFGSAGVLGADLAARFGQSDDLFVRFYVAPGRVETVAGVELHFIGPHGRTAEELSSAMRLGAGAVFSNAALTDALERIKRLYTSSGHPYVYIDAREADPKVPGEPGSRWSADHSHITLFVKVAEGPEVRFGPILIRGNFKTQPSAIRADLPFTTGDLFDVNKIAIAEANLNSHNLFNGPRVTPYGLSEKANPVPILIEVQERFDDWGTPVLSAGYSTDVGLSESVGYLWGNVFGGGGTLELRAEAAEDVTQYSEISQFDGAFWRLLQVSARYTHPHVVIPSLRAEIRGAARKEFTVRLGEIDSIGTSFTLSWVQSPRFRLFGRYDFTLSSLRSIDYERLPGRDDSQTAVPDFTTTNKLTFGAVFDDRVSFDGAKNPLLPIQGWLVAGTAAGAGALGLPHGHNFFVLSGQVQRYQPLGKGCLGRSKRPCISIIANLRGDYGIPIGESALPEVERFFAGGDNTTRGFDTDMMKTEIIRGDVSPAPATGASLNSAPVAYRIIPQGGNIRVLGTVELQFPISDIGGYPWMGALFVDAGTVFDQPQLFNAQTDVKASIGMSLLRILTPVGPLSLEYAYPVTQSLAEEEWRHETSWYLHWPGRIHFNWGIPILR